MKLDILPPGQAATKIIPMATVGVIKLLSDITKRKVINGNATTCEINPIIEDFGSLIRFVNSFGLIPKATPNIIKLKTILIACIPDAEKLILMGSSC